MTQSYLAAKVVQTSFSHSSFPGGLRGVLRFQPTDAALRVLSQVNGRFLPQANGFSLAIPHLKGKSADFPPGSRIPIVIDAVRSDFTQYTDLPFQQNHLWYFNNRSYHVPRSFPVYEPLFQLTVPNFSHEYSVSIRRLAETIQPHAATYGQATLQKLPTPTDPSATFLVDLRFEPTGAYELKMTAKEKPTQTIPFVVSKELVWQPVFGIFEVLIPGKGETWDLTTEIDLPSRSYPWVYEVESIHAENLEAASVSSDISVGGRNVSFVALSPDANSDLLRLVSSSPIPLLLQPHWEILLTTKGIPRGIRLPAASPSQISLGEKTPTHDGLYCKIPIRV